MQDDLDAVALLTLASNGVHPMGFFMDPSCPAEGPGLRPWPGAGWGLLSTTGSGGEAGLSLLPLTLLVLGATAGGDSFGSSRGPDAPPERKWEGALTVPGGGRSAGCPRASPPDAGRGLSPAQSGGESRPRTRPCSHRLPGGKARPVASPAPPPTRAPRSLRACGGCCLRPPPGQLLRLWPSGEKNSVSWRVFFGVPGGVRVFSFFSSQSEVDEANRELREATTASLTEPHGAEAVCRLLSAFRSAAQAFVHSAQAFSRRSREVSRLHLPRSRS